jgi:hypothetical protein
MARPRKTNLSRKTKAAYRQSDMRAGQSVEQREVRPADNTARHALQGSQETDSQRRARQQTDTARHALQRSLETEAQRTAKQQVDAASHAILRSHET